MEINEKIMPAIPDSGSHHTHAPAAARPQAGGELSSAAALHTADSEIEHPITGSYDGSDNPEDVKHAKRIAAMSRAAHDFHHFVLPQHEPTPPARSDETRANDSRPDAPPTENAAATTSAPSTSAVSMVGCEHHGAAAEKIIESGFALGHGNPNSNG